MKNSHFSVAIGIILLGLIALIVVGKLRSQNPQIIVQGIFFDNEGCSVPCWQEITPGESIDEEILLWVTNPLKNRVNNLQIRDSTPIGKTYSWFDNNLDAIISINRPTRVVERIDFILGTPIPFLNLFPELGNPTGYSVGLIDGHQEKYYSVYLYYGQEGFYLYIVEPLPDFEKDRNLCKYSLSEYATVKRVSFFDIKLTTDQLHNKSGPPSIDWNEWIGIDDLNVDNWGCGG